jgi:hypothetical protein
VAAKPNDLAACQVTPGSEWILAKVIHHDLQTGMYKLSDEDIESNKSKSLLQFCDLRATIQLTAWLLGRCVSLVVVILFISTPSHSHPQ